MDILISEVDPQTRRKYSALKIWCYIKLYEIFCCVSLPYCLYDLASLFLSSSSSSSSLINVCICNNSKTEKQLDYSPSPAVH